MNTKIGRLHVVRIAILCLVTALLGGVAFGQILSSAFVNLIWPTSII